MKTRYIFAMAACLMAVSACAQLKPNRTVVDKPSPHRLTLIPETSVDRRKTSNILVKINHAEERTLLKEEQMKKVRDHTVHLMIIDPSFTDYQHIHPTPTATPGLYSFPFTPKLDSSYRAWADIVPVATGKQEFVMGDLKGKRGSTLTKTVSDEATVEGYRFALSWDKPLTQYERSTGTVAVSDKSGHPVAAESALLAHVDGFHDDYRSVLHANALAESGENKMTFAVEPKKAGFLKLYALVIINGKQVIAPFGVQVKADK